jgi:glycine cleavage system aminomethyltransferase T
VSQLPFLSADHATADTFSPVSRSPMQKLQRDHGAQFETRDGWEVAVGFPDEAAVLQSAGIVELPHLGKLDVRGAGARPDAAKVLWYQMTPQRALCITLAAETSGVRASLEESARRVVDVSAGFGSLALLGPRVGELLRRVTELENFPASGIISHIHGHVLTIDGGFLLLYPQEYGQYLYEVLLDAAVPFDGGPVGVDALPSGGIW